MDAKLVLRIPELNNNVMMDNMKPSMGMSKVMSFKSENLIVVCQLCEMSWYPRLNNNCKHHEKLYIGFV
jgi:hypothetical protein